MTEVILDGEEMDSIYTAHKYLASKLNFPDYYGENLDALWDILSTVSEPTKIQLKNEDKLVYCLGDYAKSLLQVIYEAAEVNDKIILCDR